MTPERWQRIDDLFRRAAPLPASARAEFLAAECRDDEELQQTLTAMLTADASADDPLRAAVQDCAGQVLAAQTDAWHGRVLGAYRIERQLGAGGMGTVFLARRSDASYEGEVAIKILSNSFATPDERQRFLAERQILARLRHPGIAQLLDGGATEDGVPYIVMEHVEGQPIDEYCETAGLDLEDRLRLFLRVCDAVQHAHRNLVVHRDLKPANILVGPDRAPKLLDFGIAKPLDPSDCAMPAERTMAGARFLTPLHASPEQVQGLPVTTAADVYCLGALLYRLLTGTHPFAAYAERSGELERAILEVDPVRPSAALTAGAGGLSPWEARRRRREIARDLDNIVLMAMRKQPEQRYATVSDLAQDIERFLAHRPVIARPHTRSYRLQKYLQRHAVGVAATAAVMLLVGGLVAFYTQRLAEERDLQASERVAAERVAQFMVDLFKVADPNTGESGVTARELLDRSHESLATGLDDQPLIAARLKAAMGRAYAGLAAFDRALPLHQEALALRRSELPPASLEIAESLHDLGNTHAERGDYEAARAELEEALAIREQRLGPEDLAVGETLARLAFVDLRQARFNDMRTALDRSLAIHLATVGSDDRRTGSVYALLGAYHWSQAHHAEAEQAFGEALAIEERSEAPNQARIAGYVHNLGLLAWQQGEYQGAMDLYGRELELRRSHFGLEHPSVALVYYGLGVTSKEMGRYAEALQHYLDAAELQARALGTDSHYLAMTLGGYGFTLLEIGDLPAARKALSRSLEIFEARFGATHPDLRAPLVGLSKVATAEGRHVEARARLERALAIVEARLPGDHPDVLRTRISLAGAYRMAGDYAAAIALYEPSVAALERTLGLDHPYAVDALCGLGDSLARTGELDRAEAYFQRARINLSAQKATDLRIAVAECLEGQAYVLRRLGDQQQAEAADVRAREIRAQLRAIRRAEAARASTERPLASARSSTSTGPGCEG
jgi:serine/threonine-protein kinase